MTVAHSRINSVCRKNVVFVVWKSVKNSKASMMELMHAVFFFGYDGDMMVTLMVVLLAKKQFSWVVVFEASLHFI